MGNRGRIADRERARDLRAESWTLQQIADELKACRGQVSEWVRDVDFTPQPQSRARKRGPNKLQVAKQAQIDQLKAEGIERIGRLSEREFLIAGIALDAGEGSKTGWEVRFANTDPRMILSFVTWLRRFFAPDERRLRVRLYLHEGLDLDEATALLVRADRHTAGAVLQAVSGCRRLVDPQQQASAGLPRSGHQLHDDTPVDIGSH